MAETNSWRIKGWSYYNDTVAGGSGGGGDPTSTLPGGSGGNKDNPPPAKTFTQAEIDKIVANERRTYQAKQQDLAKQLEQLQSTFKGTEEEKAALASQIEELRNSALTKEQQLQRETEKQKKTFEETTKNLATEKEAWQQRYGTLLVTQKITAAAASNDAFSTEQILDLLGNRAKIVEDKDDEGKGKGSFNVVIRFEDVDAKTKQPVTLELDPDSAVKRMKELPERFGNLFKSNLTGGIGKTKVDKTGAPDIANMSEDQYREYRKTRPRGN